MMPCSSIKYQTPFTNFQPVLAFPFSIYFHCPGTPCTQPFSTVVAVLPGPSLETMVPSVLFAEFPDGLDDAEDGLDTGLEDEEFAVPFKPELFPPICFPAFFWDGLPPPYTFQENSVVTFPLIPFTAPFSLDCQIVVLLPSTGT